MKITINQENKETSKNEENHGNTEDIEKMQNAAGISLPSAFMERMQELLQDEYPDFLASYEKERTYGLRYNPLKVANKGKDSFLNRMPFRLEPVPWAEEGFYYKRDARPGKYAFHEAGAYYIQEPSAMAAVEALDPKPGERILDLCAAPGGKSTHIAGKMMGEGLLVSNEIIPGRAKILSQNIERMGIANTVVCNETPERLSEFFSEYFDKILVDAPCSGEGMFRKDETAINEWSPENVKMCADRQKIILEQAASMLRPGGVLVYSTCTFSVEENEGVIGDFLKTHAEFFIEKAGQEDYFGVRERTRLEKWIENPAPDIEHTMRLWPHKILGEGHFIARLKKSGGPYGKNSITISENMRRNSEIHKNTEKDQSVIKNKNVEKNQNIEENRNIKKYQKKKISQKKEQTEMDGIRLCREFLTKELGISTQLQEQFTESGVFHTFGEQIYLMPVQMISVKGLKVVRPGLHLGTVKKNRFEPSHALALYLSEDEVRQSYEMNEKETESYLHGDIFPCDVKLKGWTLLTTGGYSIGFGKAGNGRMKNHYPKGLRR